MTYGNDEAHAALSSGLPGLVGKIEALSAAGFDLKNHPNGSSRVAVLPDGYSLHELTAKEPEVIKATPSFDMLDSFHDYVNAFKTNQTLIFGSQSQAILTAVMDYHTPTTVGKLAHIAKLNLKHSQAWKDWNAINGRQLGQVDFAEFLEEHVDDIFTPDAATLLELVENFTEKRTIEFQSNVKRSNGNIVLSYKDTDDNSSGSTKLPEQLTLSLPVYEGEVPLPVRAFLRASTKGGELKILVKLQGLPKILADAFGLICASVEQTTTLKVAHGTYSNRSY